MKPATRAFALLGAAALLVSCSATPSEDVTEPTIEASPVEEAAAEPAEATVEQWASRIAEGKRGVVDSLDSYEEAACLPSDDTSICNAYLTTMHLSAMTMATLIEASTNESAPGYIGEAPAEIAALVAETDEAANGAVAVGDEALNCVEDCQGPVFQFTVAYDKLVTSIDAWSPYGV